MGNCLNARQKIAEGKYYIGNSSGYGSAIDIGSVEAGALLDANQGVALYDFAKDGGGAPGAIVLASSAIFPDNSIVVLEKYEVLTTCTSAADTASIKVGLATDGDLSTAIAINNATNPWDAGGYKASALVPLTVKCTGARAIVVTSATQAITAGKILFTFRYWVGA